MAIISRLAVLLGLDAGEFNANLGKAKDRLAGFASEAKLGLATVGVAFLGATKSAAEYADRINDVAKANDMSVQSVLRMSQALAINGGDSEAAGKLMSSFSNKVDEAATGSDKAQKAFTKIGVSIKDLKTLSPEQLFEKTVKSLAGIEDTTKRNAMAMDIFGRAIKGVDIKGLAESLDQNKKSFADAEMAFKTIGIAFDKIDVATQSLKVNTAKNTSQIIQWLGDWAEAHITNGDKIKAKNDELIKQYGYLATLMHMIGIKELELKVPEFGSVQGANAPGIMSGIGGIAAPKKNVRDIEIADAIKKQNEALAQQVATYNLEAKSVGQVASAYNKLQIEYEKGGKYDQANSKARAEANAAALKLDIANKNEFLKQQAEEAKNAQDLLRIQISMAGASDTQQQKALDLLKVDQEILKIKEKYPLATDLEIEALRKLKQETVSLEEQAKRTQNTFQNGFSNAFENFKEKSMDSFAQGQQAFESMASSMSSALDQFVATGKISFKSLILDMIKNLIKLRLEAQMSGFFSMLGKALGFIAGGPSAGLTATAPSSGGLAVSWSAGGNELGMGQPSMVGENGPELFVPKSAGTVVPNNRINSLMGNQPQIVYNGPYIANMSAIDTQSGLQFLAKNKQGVWAANQSAQRGLPQSR
jgi:lambda family phage tail tape measure protein